MSKMALHEPFGHLQHKLWLKEGPGAKLAIWLLTTKSWELTRPRCVQVECNTRLEISRGELQVCFRPCPNQRLERKVMNAQNPGSLNRDNFGTPLWESQEKVSFGCKCGGEAERILLLWTSYKKVENYKTRQALLIHQLVLICWRVVS